MAGNEERRPNTHRREKQSKTRGSWFVLRASCMSFSLALFSTSVLGGVGSDDDFVDPPSEFVGRPRNYREEQREASPELELTPEEDVMFPTVQTRGSVKVLYNVIKSLNAR
nr:hypothetical protein Iba_chr03aCG8180 [Ipomoea batatas]